MAFNRHGFDQGNGATAAPWCSAARRLPVLALCWALAAHTATRAAGLGEVQGVSSLGQPLEIRVGLNEVDSEALDMLRVRVASAAVYEALGMERDPALDAAVAVVEPHRGALQVRISGPVRAQEPILSLVLEVSYPHGMVRRSYSLLLDPPAALAVASVPAAAPAPVTTLPAPAPLAFTPPAEVPSAAVATRFVAERRPLPAARPRPRADLAPQFGPVPVGSTLGEIAQLVRGDERIALNKLIDRLYRANPQAFRGGPETLIAGSMLSLAGGTRNGPVAAPAQRTDAMAVAAISTAFAGLAPAPDGSRRKTLQLTERLFAVPPPMPLPSASAPVGVPPTAAVLAGAGLGLWAWLGSAAASIGLWVLLVPALLLLLRWQWRRRAAVRPSASAAAKPPPVAIPYVVPQRFDLPSMAVAQPALVTELEIEPEVLSKPLRREAPSGEASREASPEATTLDFDLDAIPASALAKPGRAETAQTKAEPAQGDTEVPTWSGDLSTQAAQLINEALSATPERSDLRYLLLELYHGDRNVEGFLQQADAFEHIGLGRRDAHWPEIERMGRELAPQHPLFADVDSAAKSKRPGAAEGATRATGFRRFYDGFDRLALQPALDELKSAHESLRRDPAFIAAFSEIMLDELSRPSTVEHYRELSAQLGGAQIYIKREDLRRNGSEQLIHIYGQVLLAKYMGKSAVVAACTDVEHGRAVAAAAAAIGLKAILYTPEALIDAPDAAGIDAIRQLNARLLPVETRGDSELRDGRRVALSHWLAQRQECSYVSNQRAGPAPLPSIISDFQAVIGQEVRRQWYRRFGHLPSAIVANVEAGPLMFGLVRPFLNLKDVRIDAVERSALVKAKVEVTTIYQPDQRELSCLRAVGRVGFASVTRAKAAEAAKLCRRYEDANPSSANVDALAHGIRIASGLGPNREVVVLYS